MDLTSQEQRIFDVHIYAEIQILKVQAYAMQRRQPRGTNELAIIEEQIDRLSRLINPITFSKK